MRSDAAWAKGIATKLSNELTIARDIQRTAKHDVVLSRQEAKKVRQSAKQEVNSIREKAQTKIEEASNSLRSEQKRRRLAEAQVSTMQKRVQCLQVNVCVSTWACGMSWNMEHTQNNKTFTQTGRTGLV